MYSDGASEQITGRLLGNLFPRRRHYVLATKMQYPTGQGPNDRGLSRNHILASIDASLAASGPITSIFTRFTAGTMRRRSRRQRQRSTMAFAPAKRFTSVRRP